MSRLYYEDFNCRVSMYPSWGESCDYVLANYAFLFPIDSRLKTYKVLHISMLLFVHHYFHGHDYNIRESQDKIETEWAYRKAGSVKLKGVEIVSIRRPGIHVSFLWAPPFIVKDSLCSADTRHSHRLYLRLLLLFLPLFWINYAHPPFSHFFLTVLLLASVINILTSLLI